MAVSGWYPDPDGTENRFRYWDGNSWSAQTTNDPSSPPPDAQAGRPSSRSGNRRPWLIGAVVIVLIIGVITLLIIRSREPEALTDPNPPAPSISGWNDSRSFPTAPPPPPRTEASQNPQGRVACSKGDPYDVQPHPDDGRIHGGSLSIVQPGGDWQRDDDYARQMTWAYDVAGADEWVEPEWLAMVAVGDVRTDDGFGDPKQAADGIMQCIASSVYYRYYTGSTTLFSKPFRLQGRSGWAIRAQVRVDDPQVQASGDVVEIIALNTGTAGQLSYFAGFVPIGDRNRLAILDNTISGMRVG